MRAGLTLVLALAAATAPVAAQDRAPAERDIRAALDALDARTSFYARHLPSGAEMAVRADQPMNTLSVIKVPIMVAAYRMAEAGQLDLDERYRVRPEDLRRGSGLLQTFGPGLEPTWRDLLTQMIVTSDNTATDIVIGRVGADRVNGLLEELGYEETRLKGTTGALFKALWVRSDPSHERLTDREVFERGFPGGEGAADVSFAVEGDSTAWLGRTTAREMADLMDRLHAGELASAEHTREMMGILRRQFYTELLPARVRRLGVSTANKTGGWGAVGANDVAVFTYSGGPVVVSAFVNQHRGGLPELEAALAGVGVEVVEAWAEEETARVEDEDLAAAVDSIARAALRDGPLPGLSVAVHRGGEPLVERGWGYADLENDVAAGGGTVYRIGSITKQFTAAAVMRLVENGRLSLDDPVSKHLPDLPAWGDRVTIHQLLNHTSGIRSYTSLGEAWASVMPLERTHGQMLALFRDEPMDFEPGEKWLYNNSGYYLLGMVVEAVTGTTYAEHLEKEFFDPLGLEGTTYCSERPLVERRAEGYDVEEGAFLNDRPISMTQPYAAGSLCSTVADLARWGRALAGGEVVTPESYRLMTTPTPLGAGGERSYGYGLSMGQLGDQDRVGHGGGINGFTSQLSYYPEADLAVAVLSNRSGAPSSRIEERIARRVLGVPEARVEDLPLTAEERAAYVGAWDVGVGRIEIVDEGEDGLWMRGPVESRLLYQGDHVFAPEADPTDRLTFRLEEGRAVGLLLVVQGMELEGVRAR